MDQEPTVWPPAPQGMVPTPQRNSFKPAPVVWVTILISITLILDCLSALLDPVMMMGGILADANLTPIMRGIASLQSCFQVTAFTAFLVWFYRTYKNLYVLEARGLPYTPGWAVAWFFIPIMNTYQPYKMAQTIWKASSQNLSDLGPGAWKHAKSGALVMVWWGLTLMAQFTIAVASADVYQSHSLGKSYYEAMVVGNLFSVAAGIATIVLLRAVTERQQAKAKLLLASSESVA